METEKTKRQIIEEVVDRHPTLSKVANYIANTHGIEQPKVKEMFINFLVKEDFYIHEGVPHSVLCFEYDKDAERFINRTIYTHGCV